MSVSRPGRRRRAEERQRPVPGPKNGKAERVSLVRAESCLIARFNSLQGRKKFPARMRREFACNQLILLLLAAADYETQGRIERNWL
jgi:hypothetical protein